MAIKQGPALLLLSSMALAAQEEKTPKESLLQQMARPKVLLESGWLTEARVGDGDGRVQTLYNRIRVNNDFVGLSYTNRNYDWKNIADLPFGDGTSTPVDQTHELNLGARLPYRFNDRWFMLNSVTLISAFEKQMEDSYSLGLFSFASYALSEKSSLQFGMFAKLHPVTSLVLPIASYSYGMRADEGLGVVVGFPRSYVGYHVSPATLLRVGIRFDQSVTRLAKQSVVEPGGYAEARDYLANAGVVYEANERLRISAEFLYSVGRELKLYRSDGSRADTYRIDPSPGVSAELRWLF